MIRLRSFVAIAALMLFPVMVLAPLVAALWVAVLLWNGDPSSWAKALAIVLVLNGGFPVASVVLAIVGVVKDVRLERHGPPPGPSVPRSGHPRLWAEIDRLAEAAGTAPPERVVLVAEANAGMIGTGGRRVMLIGVPLLAGLSAAQMRAVLAHELGHCADGGLAVAPRTLDVTRVLLRLRAVPILMPHERWLLSPYLRFLELASSAAQRDSERAADAFSVQMAGPEAAASALRRQVQIGIAWSLLTSSYVSCFDGARARAPLHVGVRALLDANRERLDESVDAFLAAERRAVTSPHPTVRDRIVACGGASDGARRLPATDADAPALSLLDGAGTWLAHAESEFFDQPWPLVSWDEVVRKAGAYAASASAAAILERLESRGVLRGRSLDHALALLDSSEGPASGAWAESWYPSGTPAERIEQAGRDILGELVVAALVDAGVAHHRVSWTGPWEIVGEGGGPVCWESVVHAALSEPDGAARLRAWLAGRGVDVATVTGTPVDSWPRLVAATSLRNDPWEERRDRYLRPA